MKLTKLMVFRDGGKLGRLGIVLSMSCLLISSAFAANTWWVAKEDPNASDANAGTEEAPFRTIQAALDNPSFAAGDTVKVKPGVYDEGESISATSVISNRVLITKACHLIGVDGAAVTHIVGARSPGSTASGGRGDYATRCIFVDADARTEDMVIEGFTLRGGSTGAGGADTGFHDVGGAIGSSGSYPFVMDCVISNCTAYKGAALRGGTAVRCYIAGNWGSSSGVAINGGKGYSCIIAYNSGSQIISSSYLCHCTLYANGTSAVLTGSGGAYNCIFVDNGRPDATRYTASNTLGSIFTATNGSGVVLADRWQFVGPAAGDWRVVAGSAAETAGDGSRSASNAFTHIPSSERYKDFYKNPIPETGTVMAGAVQQSAQVVAGGIALNTSGVNGMAIDGHPARPGDFVLATAWPTQFTVTATAGTVNRYIRRLPDATYDYVAPRMDESILVMPLPEIGSLVTNDVKYADLEYWVDPDNGDDANPGTAAEPFKTLQQSFEAVLAAKPSYPVVHAVAGNYREGGAPLNDYNGSTDYKLTNRLCMAGNYAIRYKGAGAGKSFIWGAPDPSTDDGLGDAAIGCIYIHSGTAIIQGFTLTNGYTRAVSDSKGNGNAIFGRNSDNLSILADCTVAGCYVKDAVSYNMRMHRCRVVGNKTKGTLTNGGQFSSCLFANNTFTDTSRSGVTGSSCINCSYLGTQKSVCPFGNSMRIYGCVIDTGDFIRTGAYPAVSMADNLATWNVFPTVISAVAGFNDPANGDFRVKTYSGALRCTPKPSADDAWAASFCRFAIGDVDGRPLISPDGEHVLAGAVQETVSAADTVYFRLPKGGIGDGTATYAEGDLSSSEAIDLTRAEATRPCIGFVLDGVTNLFDDLELPLALAPSANGHTVVALYTKDWYVNADGGDDGNWGYTPGSAKRTLAAILSVGDLASGDTVHAAPGTYNEGVMTYTEAKPLRARAVVPTGVTLVGDAGAERTVIVGAAATVDADSNGLGTNAIRCVTLTNAELRGFTLTGGHTARIDAGTDAGKSNSENIGGGVGFAGGSTVDHLVTDCIISNNVAWRGGGAYYASLRRCLIIRNKGCDGSGAAAGTYRCNLYGCVSAHQIGNYNVMYPGAVYDSTIIQTNSYQALYITTQNCPVRNTLVFGTAHNERAGNVAYNTLMTTLADKGGSFLGEGSAVVDKSQLLFDADFRPVIGANVAIDAANPAYANAASTTTAADGTLLDLLGGQRIYNGQRDIGALEADWRPTYATRLGGPGLTVLSASPEVVTGAVSSVCIPTGTVTMAWANIRAPRPVRQTFGVEVTGTGTLTVTVDGETATYTAADGALKLTRKTTDAETALSFVYQPGEEDTGCAILFGFERYSGTTLCFR